MCQVIADVVPRVFKFDVVSEVQQLDVLRREVAYSASTAPPPGQRTRAVQQVDDVAALEVEVGGLTGGVVTERLSQARFLDEDRAEHVTSGEHICI